jgi:ABC-type multidrug transport system fused ATPase/permease subunit
MRSLVASGCAKGEPLARRIVVRCTKVSPDRCPDPTGPRLCGGLDDPAARPLPRIKGHVRFEDVQFSYGTGPEVLHGIDLDVPAGTTVALVGHTGAGKSTIAKLIARFYDPTGGRITVSSGERKYLVDVDWLTGRVYITD